MAIFCVTLLLSILLSRPALAQIPTTLGWHQLASTTIRSVCPAPAQYPTIQGAEGCAAVTDDWSGGTFDTVNNRLLIAGGGHQGYAGNEWYALNLGNGSANPTIQRLNDPSVPVRDGCTNGGIYADGTPVARHWYDHLAYLPALNVIFAFGGAFWECGNFGNDGWYFNLTSLAWSTRSNTNAPDGSFSFALAYDPNTGLVYARDDFLLRSYNPTTNSWTVRSTSFAMNTYKTAVIDPKRKRYYITTQDSSSTLYYYDISSPTATNLNVQSVSPSGCNWIGNGQTGIEYDPVQDRIVTWDGGNSVQLFNPANNSCSTVTYSNGPPSSGPSVTNGVYGRFRYSPKLNVFVTCTDVDANCYALRLTAQTPPPDAMPSVDQERQTYVSWGWTWNVSAEPNYPTDNGYSVAAANVLFHDDTEGDDLWTYRHMYNRSGQGGYLSRANAWETFYKNSWTQCLGGSGDNYCTDRDSWGGDHLYGYGLLKIYQDSGNSDSTALARANTAGDLVEFLWNNASTPYACLNGGGSGTGDGCMSHGPRHIARHILLIARLYEVTGDAGRLTLLNTMTNKLLTNSSYDAARGMYWFGPDETDEKQGAGAYAAGARIQSTFLLGLLAEAMYQAWRVTGGTNTNLSDRLVTLASYVKDNALNPTFNYTASFIGKNTSGNNWWSFFDGGNCTEASFDPVYTTDAVGLLVFGYKFTGDSAYLSAAKTFFNRGTKGVFGDCTTRTAGDTVAHHFIDTMFDSASGNFYLDWNKGELLYTWALFENGGFPRILTAEATEPPAQPSVSVRRRIQ